MSSSSGSTVASNILVNHDFSSGLHSWRANTCDASLVPDGQGRNYAVVTNRTKRWQGLEQDITGKVSAGLTYTVSARVCVSSRDPGSDFVEATLRLEFQNSNRDYKRIFKTSISRGQWQTLEGEFSLQNLPDRKIVFYLEGPPPGVDLLIHSVFISTDSTPWTIERAVSSENREAEMLAEMLQATSLGESRVNIITNSSFDNDTEGWFPVHKCGLSVKSDGNIRYILATKRDNWWEGPGQWISDKLQLSMTYKVSARVRTKSGVNEPQIAIITFKINDKDYVDAVQAEVNGDEWHEIVGSFRLEKPAKVMVYVHGFQSGVDLMLAGLQISPVNRRATFEYLKTKTNEVRKRDVILRFSGSGLPKPGTFVNVKQTQNSFPIGSCISHDDLDNKYLVDFFVKNFNWATFEYELKWYQTEPEQGKFKYKNADKLLEFCVSHSIKMRGHCIVWEEEPYIPKWVKELERNDQVREAILKRVRDLLTRYKAKFQHYDVDNEMLHETYFRDRLGDDIREAMFKTAKLFDPTAKLFTNEYHIGDGCSWKSSPEKYIQLIQKLQSAGAPVEGVGIQGHIRSPPVGDIVCSALDKLGQLGLPIWFTEIDVPSENENVRAEDLEVMLREAFAHPAVEGIMLWGFWEGNIYKKNGHLVNRGGDLNAAGRKFLELKQEWMSNESEPIDNQGQVKFKGFQGRYELKIGSRKFTFDVPTNPWGQPQSPHVVHISL